PALRLIRHNLGQALNPSDERRRRQLAKGKPLEPLAVGRFGEEAPSVAQVQPRGGGAGAEVLGPDTCRECEREEEAALRLDPRRIGEAAPHRRARRLQPRTVERPEPLELRLEQTLAAELV